MYQVHKLHNSVATEKFVEEFVYQLINKRPFPPNKSPLVRDVLWPTPNQMQHMQHDCITKVRQILLEFFVKMDHNALSNHDDDEQYNNVKFELGIIDLILTFCHHFNWFQSPCKTLNNKHNINKHGNNLNCRNYNHQLHMKHHHQRPQAKQEQKQKHKKKSKATNINLPVPGRT